MIIGRKKEIEMLRDAYESELPRHIIHLSGRHYHHLIISVSSAYNPCSFHLWVFFRTRILRIDADASLVERVSPPDKIRYIRTIRVRFTSSESFFRTLIYRIDADASLVERVSPLDKIRWIRWIRVRFTSQFFFEHGFIGLTRMLRSVGGTVFQTAVLSMVINPETASRVTLAYARYWLPASTKLHVCSW